MTASLIRRLYAYRFFDDFILIYPLYQVMFVDRGLSIGQISWLFIIWSTVSILAEVPSGVLADRYSRKKLLALGQAIRAVGYGLWFVLPDFWGFAAGFALWGIGSAFDSGTFQALLYDELKAVGREREYVKVQGRAQSFSLAGNFFATALAAAAVLLGYPALLGFSVLAVLVSGLIALSLPQAPPRETVADTRYFVELWGAVKEAAHAPAILSIIVLAGFIAAVFGSLEEYTPIFFHDLQWSLSGISLGQAAIVLATVGASIVAYKFEALRNTRFFLLLGASGLALIGAGTVSSVILAPMLIGGFFFLTKLLETVFDGKLQHSISSHRRATITSVGGFVAEIMSLGIYAGFGGIADHAGSLAAFAWFGGFVTVVAVLYMLINHRANIFTVGRS